MVGQWSEIREVFMEKIGYHFKWKHMGQGEWFNSLNTQGRFLGELT